jgi:hypothetical protein
MTMTTPIISGPAVGFDARSWLKGAALAGALCRQARNDADGTFVLNAHEHGRQQDNIVLRFLQRAQAAGPQAEAGFCAALSDVLALTVGGTPVDVMPYAKAQARHRERAAAQGVRS